MSLEAAVRKLMDIVPEIERTIFIVKQHCREPNNGLTSDESASVMLYTYEMKPHEGSLYFILNIALRSDQRHQIER